MTELKTEIWDQIQDIWQFSLKGDGFSIHVYQQRPLNFFYIDTRLEWNLQ